MVFTKAFTFRKKQQNNKVISYLCWALVYFLLPSSSSLLFTFPLKYPVLMQASVWKYTMEHFNSVVEWKRCFAVTFPKLIFVD